MSEANSDRNSNSGSNGELSEQQMSDLQEAFDVFDNVGDGTITTRKLFRVMRSLGQNPTEAEVQDLINAVDDDGNGTIEFDEFVAMMSTRIEEQETHDELRCAFKVFDQKNKGHITVDDLTGLMEGLNSDLNQEEIAEMVRQADKQGNNHITFEGKCSLPS